MGLSGVLQIEFDSYSRPVFAEQTTLNQIKSSSPPQPDQVSSPSRSDIAAIFVIAALDPLTRQVFAHAPLLPRISILMHAYAHANANAHAHACARKHTCMPSMHTLHANFNFESIPCRLTVEQKLLVWLNRNFCTKDPRLLTKFLESVDWTTAQHVKEALTLLTQWEVFPVGEEVRDTHSVFNILIHVQESTPPNTLRSMRSSSFWEPTAIAWFESTQLGKLTAWGTTYCRSTFFSLCRPPNSRPITTLHYCAC